jgi:hypothetical protein
MSKDFWEKAQVCRDEPLSHQTPIMAINYPKPRKIVEYWALAAKGKIMFDYQVSSSIKNGWQPFGGVSMHIDDSNLDETAYYFAQAMVKYEE